MSPAAGRRRSASPPRSRCAISSSPASATASPRAKAIRTGRSRCPTKASASAPISERPTAQYYRPSRAGYKGGRACEAPGRAAGLAAPERAVVQPGLPPLALQLPDPHRAGARRAISAHRGDLSAAGLHRRHHRRRPVRLAARARMPADQNRRRTARARSTAQLAELREALDRREAPPARRASSIWCCCRSAPTTSISPASSPT